MSKKILLLALAIAILAVVPANAAVRNLYIAATDGWAYLPSDNTVEGQTAERAYYIRGFCDDVDGATATQGCATFPAPIIDVTQGDDVFINLRNLGNLNDFAPEDPHTIHLHGMHVTSQNDGFPETSWEVPEGATGTYYFRAESPGTYMWHCHVEASEHVQMGMYGALIIRPRKSTYNSVYGGFTADTYDVEYVVLLSDIETEAHDFIQTALCVEGEESCAPVVDDYNFADYDPDAWVVNGRAFPDTVHGIYDAAACVARPADERGFDHAGGANPGFFEGCNPEFSGPPNGFLTGSNNVATYEPLVSAPINSRILLRVINMGYEATPWHIHGWHFRAVGKDARPIKPVAQPNSFTLNIASGETYDLIITADDLTNLGLNATESNFYGDPNPIAVYLGSCPGGAPCDTSMDGVTNDYWYPMHSHDDYKVTNFGEYPGGQLSIIHVNGFAAPAAEEDEGNTDTIQSSPGGISEIGR
jgi:FtsP/CotA-like multicopper oxidase with cupredoxin domain